MNFVEGARYSEAAAGTNGIGTVLAADHALQVFASEHFNQRHHGWTCSGAPVHDPVSGRALGVVDLSSPWGRGPPAQPGARDQGRPGAGGSALPPCDAKATLGCDGATPLWRRGQRMYSVSPDGYVLAGERFAAAPRPLAIPEGGGEILLGDGSLRRCRAAWPW